MANIPNTTNPISSQTFFNGYFSQPVQVSSAVWGQVYGYFYGLTNSTDAANALSQAVIALTHNNNLDPLTTIREFQKNANSSNIKSLLVSFFNNSKGPSSKIGYKNNNSISPNVSRNLLA